MGGTTAARGFSVVTKTGNDARSALAYDAESRRVLLVAEGSTSDTTDSQSLNAVVLDGQGNVVSGPSPLPSQQTSMAWHGPAVIATRGGQFVVSYIADASAVLERFSLPLASTPGPRWSHVAVTPESPPHASQVGSSFDVAGWAVDRGAPSGTGVKAIHVWAFPTNGAATFLGVASYGASRPDVATGLGNTQFTNSGFSLTATVAPGTYDLYVFAYSTVSNSFDQARIVRVTVN